MVKYVRDSNTISCYSWPMFRFYSPIDHKMNRELCLFSLVILWKEPNIFVLNNGRNEYHGQYHFIIIFAWQWSILISLAYSLLLLHLNKLGQKPLLINLELSINRGSMCCSFEILLLHNKSCHDILKVHSFRHFPPEGVNQVHIMRLHTMAPSEIFEWIYAKA